MGLSFAMLTLRNPRYPDLPSLEVEALADTGSTFLCVPADVAETLRLETHEYREATIADGSRRRVPYVGPLEVRFKNRSAFVGALVLGERVLLGAIPMEDMDLVVSPLNRRVDVNPASPDVASCLVMAVRLLHSPPSALNDQDDDDEGGAEALRRDAELDANPGLALSQAEFDRSLAARRQR